ncbi:hypothetical protein pEaSNUABM11_00085 [Erwinia phage pEa_SNUABM_11]|nr:hypothetical protein pEaSNUABM11_00085 [Erwinia phage pEa_SNUABM_11]
MTEDNKPTGKGVIVKVASDSVLPQTEDGLVGEIHRPGYIETRGLGGEQDPHWWKNAEAKRANDVLASGQYGAFGTSLELQELLNSGRIITIAHAGQNKDFDGDVAIPHWAKQRSLFEQTPKPKESRSVKNYRNVMNGLISRAAKPTYRQKPNRSHGETEFDSTNRLSPIELDHVALNKSIDDMLKK